MSESERISCPILIIGFQYILSFITVVDIQEFLIMDKPYT